MAGDGRVAELLLFCVSVVIVVAVAGIDSVFRVDSASRVVVVVSPGEASVVLSGEGKGDVGSLLVFP